MVRGPTSEVRGPGSPVVDPGAERVGIRYRKHPGAHLTLLDTETNGAIAISDSDKASRAPAIKRREMNRRGRLFWAIPL